MPLPGLLAQLTVDPGRPRLTWYAPAERVELSGHVLDNWVTKTANLLVEEYDAGPGTRILLDLPVHWRAVVWAIAAWRVGASVVLPPATGRLNLVVTDRPAEHSGVDVVAVALPALARSYAGELPIGAVDATGAVLTYGDVLTWMPEPDPIGPAIEHSGPNVRHDHLVLWGEETLTRHGGARPGGRVLVETTDDRAPLADVLGMVLAVYAHDGSVVLRHDAADVSTARLVETELVTDQIGL
jgi:uncharacterized protein (TIGR03089 family)